MQFINVETGEPIVFDKPINSRKNKYGALCEKLKGLEVGKMFEVTTELGFDPERTLKHNTTNISSAVGKWVVANLNSVEATKGFAYAFGVSGGKLYCGRMVDKAVV